MTVIKWYHCTSKELKVFVRNRINLIKRLSGGTPPRYVNTTQNPADLATRGLSANESVSSKEFDFWSRGPKFLSEDESTWPVNSEVPYYDPNSDQMLKSEMIDHDPVQVYTGQTDDEYRFFNWELQRCRTLSDAARRIRTVLKIVRYWLKTATDKGISAEYRPRRVVTVKECYVTLIRIAQRQSMTTILIKMENGNLL